MYDEERPYREIRPHYTAQERRGYWECAKGLQKVDGLAVSEYAEGLAEQYIGGSRSASELEAGVVGRYREGGDENADEREADIVSARIVTLLESAGFSLSPATLVGIHKRLFEDVFERRDWVGCFRSTNIQKEEPVLGGNSVCYADFAMIRPTLEYDFAKEAQRRHTPVGDPAETAAFARFIGDIWQVHPFREGNTCTTAVFAQMYLRYLGLEVDNTPFAENSVYFRDALVRANFSSVPLGILPEPRYLEMFFANVMQGAHNDLDSQDLNLHGIRSGSDIAYRETRARAARAAADGAEAGMKEGGKRI